VNRDFRRFSDFFKLSNIPGKSAGETLCQHVSLF
jgi:hypothetical protein